MFYNPNRDQLRQKFFDVYNKFNNKIELDGVEKIILTTIQDHGEYLYMFDKQAYYLHKDYHVELGETNPFLHMSSHIGLHEQLSTNRPKGISKIYQALVKSSGKTAHEVEHIMVELMLETLWQAQRDNQEPDEKSYLKKLKKLMK